MPDVIAINSTKAKGLLVLYWTKSSWWRVPKIVASKLRRHTEQQREQQIHNTCIMDDITTSQWWSNINKHNNWVQSQILSIVESKWTKEKYCPDDKGHRPSKKVTQIQTHGHVKWGHKPEVWTRGGWGVKKAWLLLETYEGGSGILDLATRCRIARASVIAVLIQGKGRLFQTCAYELLRSVQMSFLATLTNFLTRD